MQKIKTYNLALGLPLLIFGLFISLTLFQSWQHYNKRVELVVQYNYSNLQDATWQLARSLEYELAKQDMAQVQQEIANFALRENAVFSAVLEPNGTILLASVFSWNGQHVDDVIMKIDAAALQQSFSASRLNITRTGDALTAMITIADSSEKAVIRSHKKKLLLLRIDMDRELQQALLASFSETVPLLVVTFLLLVLLFYIINRIVIIPLQKLHSLANQLNSPTADLNSPFSGDSDYSQVAQAIVNAGKNLFQQLTTITESEAQLRVTLQSIGDAVIVTKPDGQIVLMNSRASELTGWSEKQALGQKISLVFDIYQADTNKKIVNPIDTVLTTGSAEFHTSNTLLKSKSGEHLQISNCAAAIKTHTEGGEHNIGVILVFQDVTEQNRLQDQKQLFGDIVERSLNEIYIFEQTSLSFIQVNKGGRQNLGYSNDEIMKLTPVDIKPEYEEDEFRALLEPLISGDVTRQEFETIHQRKDGSRYPVEVDLQLDKSDKGNVFVAVINDISDRKQTEQELMIKGKVFDAAIEGILICDAKNNIIQVNASLCRLSGYSSEELIGKNPRVFKSGKQNLDFYKEIYQSILKKGAWTGEIEDRKKDGSVFTGLLAINTILDDNDKIRFYIAVISDISGSKAAKARIEFLAHHDVLTHLPNRELFADRFNQALITAERYKQKLAMLFVDIDRFKFINDSLGHSFGDSLLIQVAHRLIDYVREEDTVSRCGGDEFTILLINTDAKGAAHVANSLAESFQEPFTIEGQELFVTLSIGISTYPDSGTAAHVLYQNADTAMYRAKQGGRNQYQFFTEEMHLNLMHKIELEKALGLALERDELELVYQPQIDINSHKIIGCEALIRWKHPEQGYIPPNEFIPIAEENGLIIPIGDWVLQTAIKQLRVWVENEQVDIIMAVNLSGVQFEDPQLVSRIQILLEQNNLPTTNLDIEITESIAMKNIDLTITQLQVIAKSGIYISLDDFGTGYSSLNYLKKFPISKLKIDQSFIAEMLNDKDDEAIVDTVIALAKSLGLETIAEGVETKAHLDALKEKGCDQIQGYYFSKPLPAEQFTILLNLNKDN